MQYFQTFSELASQYDAFILDLWGVVHDGAQLYPGAKECLAKLKAEKKKIVMLSNAPRRASVAAETLAKMGIDNSQYDAVITSGEVAYHWLARKARNEKDWKKYIYRGLEKDRRILDGLPYEETDDLHDADFLLISHFERDYQPMDELLPLLKHAAQHGMPCLCINPDREVVRLSGERVECAGIIAEMYEKLGGKVQYFGKPHGSVYAACFMLLQEIPKECMLAVGDSLITDIRGAQKFDIDTALVTGGILKSEFADLKTDKEFVARIETLAKAADVTPNFALKEFSW